MANDSVATAASVRFTLKNFINRSSSFMEFFRALRRASGVRFGAAKHRAPHGRIT
jgi:hypothetical protein